MKSYFPNLYFTKGWFPFSWVFKLSSSIFYFLIWYYFHGDMYDFNCYLIHDYKFNLPPVDTSLVFISLASATYFFIALKCSV